MQKKIKALDNKPKDWFTQDEINDWCKKIGTSSSGIAQRKKMRLNNLSDHEINLMAARLFFDSDFVVSERKGFGGLPCVEVQHIGHGSFAFSPCSSWDDALNLTDNLTDNLTNIKIMDRMLKIEDKTVKRAISELYITQISRKK